MFLPPEPASGGAAPVIVFFFGGGWNGGSPSQFFPQASHFAARGMIAISAEYRTRTSHGTTPFESVEDGMSAVRWIRSHAADLGIDPDRLVAAGGSAGGQIAAAAAMLHGLDEPHEDLGVSRRPDALVLFNPVIDNGPGGYGFERIGARYVDFSPLHNVDSTAPPTLVLLGTEDHLVPVSTARRFQQAMMQAGVRSDLRLFEGQGHGFFNYRDGENPLYERTLWAADEFLQSLGYLAPCIQEKAPVALAPHLCAGSTKAPEPHPAVEAPLRAVPQLEHVKAHCRNESVPKGAGAEAEMLFAAPDRLACNGITYNAPHV